MKDPLFSQVVQLLELLRNENVTVDELLNKEVKLSRSERFSPSFSIDIEGLTKKDLKNRIEETNIAFDSTSQEILKNLNVSPPYTIDVVEKTLRQLGYTQPEDIQKVCHEMVHLKKLETFSYEEIIYLRLNYLNNTKVSNQEFWVKAPVRATRSSYNFNFFRIGGHTKDHLQFRRTQPFCPPDQKILFKLKK